MAAAPTNLSQLNKVVVACLDGRRLKGYLYNFSALKDFFDLLPQENPLQERGTRVDLKDIKAVFFVRDFTGSPDRKRNNSADSKKHGRKIEVSCKDGEVMVGMTEGYNPQKLGFFMFPIDEDDNNIRAFVVNKNVTKVKWVN
jgi:small nuclear ribonucleoprotein (snRNP)-like protein